MFPLWTKSCSAYPAALQLDARLVSWLYRVIGSVCDGRLSLVSFVIVVVAGEGVHLSEVGRRWYFLRIVRLRIGG